MNVWRATGMVALANAGALGLQFFTTILVARQFGTSAQMDAYTFAISIPESLQYVLMLATLSVLFTPLWIDARARLGENEAWNMALALLASLTLVVIVLLPLFYLFMPTLMGWLAPGLSVETRALAVELSDLILPGLVYYATAGILLGICYAHYDFRVAALNTLLLAGLNLAAFLVFVQWGNGGVRGLMLGRLVALGGAEIFLLWGALRHARGIAWRLRLWHPEFGALLRYMPPYIFGALSGQVALFINRAFVSTLGAGSVAAWGYGQRLSDIPMAIVGAALGATFLPDFAAQLAAHDPDRANASWNRAVLRVWLLMTPIAILMMTLAVPLITLFFQRGSFDVSSTQMSALVLVGLAAGLPLGAVAGLVVRGMPAFKTRWLPLALSALSTLTNVVLDVALIGVLGLFGVSLAEALGDMVFAVVGAVVFWRWMQARPNATLAAAGKILLAALVAGGASFSALRVIQSVAAPVFFQVAVSGVVGAGLYVLLTWVFDLGETRTLWTAVRQRVLPH